MFYEKSGRTDALTLSIGIIAFIVISLTAMIVQVECADEIQVSPVKVQVVPLVAQGPRWFYGIDVYNHSDDGVSVTVDYQDINGVILRSDDVVLSAYNHRQVQFADHVWSDRVKTIIITGNGATMVTAYQMCRDEAGDIVGVSTIPVYEDNNLKN